MYQDRTWVYLGTLRVVSTLKSNPFTDRNSSTRNSVPLMESNAGHEQTKYPSFRLHTGIWTSHYRPRTHMTLSPRG